MSTKLRRVTAWVALFFMLVFLVCFMALMYNSDLFEGRLLVFTIFSFVVALVLFLVLRINDSQQKRMDDMMKQDSETDVSDGE